MWHKNEPLFSNAVGRVKEIPNRPIFSGGKGITKKPSDINDFSKSKITFNQKAPRIMTEGEVDSKLKQAREVKCRSGKIDENKWMWTMMKRARQV